MASFSVSIDGIDQLQKLRLMLNPALYDRAMRGGINYASKAVSTAVAKGIRESYNITSARIKKDISGVRFDPSGQSATIRFSRRPPTLTQYGAKPGTRGSGQPGLGRGKGWGPPAKPGRPLTAMVIRQQGRKPFRNAFMVTGNNANQIVLRRSNTSSRLYSVYGPSIGSIFLGNSAISQKLQADVAIRINDQFIKGFQRVLDSASRGYGGR
jgi:hypothetical protein